MEIALAVVMILSAIVIGALALYLLTRLVRTILELRKITVGLNEVLGWSVGQVLAQRGGGARRPAAHERVQRS